MIEERLAVNEYYKKEKRTFENYQPAHNNMALETEGKIITFMLGIPYSRREDVNNYDISDAGSYLGKALQITEKYGGISCYQYVVRTISRTAKLDNGEESSPFPAITGTIIQKVKKLISNN